MRNGDDLTAAITAADLPALIHEHYPESRAKPGREGVVFASWRDNKDTPAVSLSRVEGRWLWKDHATGEGGSAFEWLLRARTMDRQEAATYLLERAGMAPTAAPNTPRTDDSGSRAPSYTPVSSEAVSALNSMPLAAVPVMRNRGFNRARLETYNLRSDNGVDALIPITSPEGVVLQVKRRLGNPTNSGKYRYEHQGHHAPPWCSSNSREAPMLFIIEGELSAIIAHAALQEAGHDDIGVMGVAGANSPLYPGLCRGKRVLVYADDDEAGEKARVAWAKAAHEDGARSVHVAPPNRIDFCDHAGAYGVKALATLLDAVRHAAEQAYGVNDRLLGRVTIREVMERTRSFLEGGVMHSTGFKVVDRATGGIREVGIYGIAALSSMGKSAVLRRMLLAHVRDGGSVRVYSPDQPATAIYRLLANQLSGVGVEEIRLKAITPEAIRLHGTPEAAKQAWWDAYQHVLAEIAPRFQVSEEFRMSAIEKDMVRAVDEGVTMFGVDYLQLLRPTVGHEDGDQADELQAASANLGVPVLATLQLAKYKYPPTRVSGLPVVGDIEGSGAYFQDSEMMFMVYNEEIYRAKYAGHDWQPEHDTPGMARLLLTKDKEGSGNYMWHTRWDARLAAYTDAGPYDLKSERKGLM